MLNDWNASNDIIVDRYKQVLDNGKTCEKVPSEQWPLSSTLNRSRHRNTHNFPLIINPGEGTTATRFFDFLFKHLGFSAGHNVGDSATLAKCHQLDGAGVYSESQPTCTELFDHKDYISDSPVSEVYHQLLGTHPDALIVHTLRPAKEWRHKRIRKHRRSGADGWLQASVCGTADHPMDHTKTPLDFMVYNVWARCITVNAQRKIPPESKFRDPADYYIALNVFQYKTTGRDDILALLLFLNKHGVLTEAKLPDVFEGKVNTFPEMANALNAVVIDAGHLYHKVREIYVPFKSLKLQ